MCSMTECGDKGKRCNGDRHGIDSDDWSRILHRVDTYVVVFEWVYGMNDDPFRHHPHSHACDEPSAHHSRCNADTEQPLSDEMRKQDIRSPSTMLLVERLLQSY